MRETPKRAEIIAAVGAAEQAMSEARAKRARWRRRSEPGGRRQEGIRDEIRALLRASKPIRRYMGMYQFHELPYDENAMRELSKRLQYERAQLRKMLR